MKTLINIVLLGIALIAIISIVAPVPTHAATTILGNFELPCNPIKPLKDGGCGLPALMALIDYVVGLLQEIVIPIATLVALLGGFVILTSGGSEEKFKKGSAIITAAVIGVAITLLAGLVVNLACQLASCPQ